MCSLDSASRMFSYSAASVGKKPANTIGFTSRKPGSGSVAAPWKVGDRVTDLRVFGGLDVGRDEADLAGPQLVDGDGVRRKAADLGHVVGATGGHELDAVALLERALHHAQLNDGAAVAVVPAVEQQRAQRRVGDRPWAAECAPPRPPAPRARRRRSCRWRTARRCSRCPTTSSICSATRRRRRRQVDLVQDRNDLEVVLDGQIGVGHGLSLNALRRVDDQERAFARAQAARDLVVEVDVPGGVDQLELVVVAVLRTEASGAPTAP